MAETFEVLLRARMDVADVTSEVGKIQKSLQGLTLPKGISDNLEKSFGRLTPLLKDYQKQLNKGFSSQKDLNNFNLLREKIGDVLGDVKTQIDQINSKEVRVKTDDSAITKMEKDLAGLQSKLQTNLDKLFKTGSGQTESSILGNIGNLEKNLPKQYTAVARAVQEIKQSFTGGEFATANNQLANLLNTFNSFKPSTQIKIAEALDLKGFKGTAESASSAFKQFIKDTQTDITAANQIDALRQKISELAPELDKVKVDAIANALITLGDASGDINQVTNAMQQLGAEGEQTATSILSMKSQVDQLKTSTQYFFGLRNMINLLKRGVKEAVDTIKQLDAVMTETAVVTTNRVGDMWKMLPEYTANANALGATVQDMYESTTLYYQQGLNTEQAMGIAAETMKMARIGGLEAADATDKMTAALRGFNMEINETSAQRVNDVYSNLAAKTASNTEELGTAMQRTASIAASAGMSFEGTAAFLAQAIETTREPAENLGTAMKTIVARFTELKKSPLEIAEVDGEEVSYNKVDTALQSIGVSLKDTNGQFRALDEVFLDISQRWDGLTQTQQRYIATTAAGSRQQSRFIAMMSDYERTMQLMDYANNSAGASEEQFGKTLEGLEAKLNKFKNAWKEFLMGIMNDSFTKGIVDGATKALDIVNKLIDTLSFGNKGIQSVLSLFTAFTALKVAGRGANMLIGGLGGLVDPKSSFREGLSGGALGGQAAKIANPIVKAIYSLIPHIDGKVTQQNQNQPYGNFKQAKQDLSKSLSGLTTTVDGKKYGLIEGGKYSLSGVQQIFDQNGLNNPAQQKALFASFPGLKKNMTSALTSLMKESSAKPEVTKGLMEGFKQGQLTSKDVLQQSGLLTNFSKAVETRTKEDGQKAGQAFVDAQRRTIDKETYKATRSQGRKEGLTDSALDSYVTKGIDDKLNQKGSIYAKNQKVEDALVSEQQLTKSQQFANTIGKVGGALSSAGMSLQMFGSQLALTNPLLGELTMKMGGLLSAAGSIPNMVSSLVAGGPAVWAITGAVVALGGAFIAVQKQQQNIREAAEEVTTNFKDTSKQTQDNIASLKAYRDELATLSKGVDQNGNNINLSDSDYNRYLEIVDDIAAMNPEIVEGYNAQGHAIIANNVALEKTLALQTQLQKEATDTYLQEESLQKLINARNINKDYTQQVTDYNGSKAEDAGLVQNIVNPFANDVKSLAKQIGKLDGFDESILQNYGIKSLDALKEGEKQAVDNFVQHRDQIEAALSNSGVELSESVIKGFDTLGENQAAFEEAIQPVYEWLSTSLSQNPLFEELPEEIRPALQNGLKAIASDTSMSAKQMTSESKKLLNSFNNLTVNNNKYKNSLETVADAQEKFADTLNETEYKAEVQPAINSLNELKRQAESMGTAAGDAIAEYLENQIAKISNFAQEGGVSLSEALNSATDDIAAAEGALEDFNKATEKDFWTAAEGMKSIYDKIFETYKDSYGTEYEKHTEGLGDATFWEGAKQLLNEKALTGGIDAVAEKIKKLEPILREGQEGVDSFLDLVAEHSSELEKLSGVEMEDGWFKNIPEEQWGAVAEELGISENLLTSMLNKARQFGLIDFDNLSKVREALATSDNVLQGTSTDANGKKALYVKEDTMRAELAAAGYTDRDRQDAELEKLQNEQNIQTIKTLDNLPKNTAEKLVKEDLNIKDFPQLVSTLSKTGDYNKDEILDMAEKANFGDKANLSDTYDEIVQALENPELAEQTSELRTVNSQLSAIQALIANGGDPNKIIDEGKKAEKERKDTLYGSDGGKQISADSAAEMFAVGKNTNGDFLSVAEFETTREALTQSAEEYRKTADSYSELAKIVTDPQQKADLTSLAQKAIQDAEYTEELIKKGTQYQSNREVEQQQKRIAEEGKYEKEKQAWEQSGIDYQDYKDARDEGRKQARNYTTNDLYKNNQLAQTYVDNLNQATADAFSQINPQAIANNPQMLNAAQILSETVAGKITPTSEDLNYALNTLGVKEGTSSYDAFMNYIQGKAQEYVEGMDQAGNDAIDSGVPGAGYAAGAGGFPVKLGNKLGEWIKELCKEPEVPNIDPKTDSGFRTKVQTQLKTWWDNLTKTPEVPDIDPKTNGSLQPQVSTEPAKITVDNSEANSKLEETKQKGEDTKSSIEGSVSLDVTVPGAEKIKQAAKDAKKLKGAQGNTNVSVNASVSGTDKVQSFNKAAKEAQGLNSKSVSYTASVSGTSNVWSAVSAGQSFQSLYDKTVTYTTVHKTVNENGPSTGGYITSGGVLYRSKGGSAEWPGYPKKGTDRIRAYLTPGEYVQNKEAVDYFGIDFMRHINHRDLTGALQSFGSAARGNYGQVGPKGKGGMTLTGELGYEIAWIPSENRSMILGANGPQMVDLPSDAVIYTHEQSKKIVRQKSIPAGSHAASATGSKKKYTSRYGSSSSSDSSGGGSDKKGKKDKKDDKKTKKTSNKGGKVSVWWLNQVRKVDAVTRKMDKAADNFNKLIKRMGTTRETANKSLAAYKKTINQTIKLNKVSLAQANKELKNLDTNKKRKQTIKWGKDKKESISLAGYIKKDKATGAYTIDQAAINKVAKKDKEKATAIREAAEKEINDRVSKQKSAEDEKKKAQDALNELSNQMYETFGRWEKSINRIYLLSQRLEVLTKQIENAGSRVELELDKIKAIGSDDSSYDKIINALKAETDSMTEKARAESANLDAVIQDFKDSLNLKTYYQIYQKDPNSTAAKDDFFAAKRALMLLEESSVKNPDGSYNYKAVLDALNNAGYSKEKYEAIKGVIDKIFEKQNAVYDTINEAYGSVAELYQRMEEMQSFISDFESELLSGLEEQTQQEINKLEKLNDSLTDALKDLLDEVKEKLEERRKAEDNKKTESDISKKQQRLNLLRADTSGSHATEIAQLEKELADARQDYQRSLEDQLLDKLQKQGDEAAKQRERQIKLLDAQRAIAQATGVDIATVKEWMKNPETYKADMREAWLAGKGYEDAGPAEREQLEQEFEATFAQFRGYQNELANLDTITSILEKIAQSIDNRNTSDNTTADPIVSGKDIKAKGWTAAQARKAGYQAKTLYGAGYSAKEIHDAGYSAKEFKEGTGLSAADAIKAGYSGKEVAAAYGASAAMIGANVSGKAAQAGSGASAKELQEIVNKSKDDKATQADMAGVSVGKVTIDTNGSKKGGNKTINDAHISADGHTVGANIGSTLYTADWDEKTGTIKGKWKKIPIDKLTPALIKKYPIDGKQALERAIENTGIGKKINGSFKSLVTAANIIGKAYKLSNGIYGSISQDGWIFYNKGKEGVYKWNPSKSTKPAFEKYNKSNFIKKAKYKNVGREYAQVLKANKVKGYKTGGLADYTGPAWLDGTKSKPELVLNAQDTKNFLALKDVLSHVMSSTTNLNNTYGGDMNFDININVDHINNDYDVDKIADRIKKKIVQDSSYRNVTQVRKFR